MNDPLTWFVVVFVAAQLLAMFAMIVRASFIRRAERSRKRTQPARRRQTFGTPQTS